MKKNRSQVMPLPLACPSWMDARSWRVINGRAAGLTYAELARELGYKSSSPIASMESRAWYKIRARRSNGVSDDYVSPPLPHEGLRALFRDSKHPAIGNAVNGLVRAQLYERDQIAMTPDAQLLAIRGFGVRCLEAIREVVPYAVAIEREG